MRPYILPVVSLAAAAFSLSVSAFEMPETKVSMEACMSAALAQVDGEVKALKLEIEDGKPLYEFKIEADEGHTWEVECDAMTGSIVDQSREASRNDPEFRSAATVVERDARARALAQFPGKVSSSSPQIANGKAIYEIEIDGADGKEYEVAIDAATGEVLSSEVESDEETIYEIGD
ncbi:MAG: PepSY domain-containing protein [Burkholderiales bacterium]|nr:PepSY domain-containing protein [Burkholderiales bacterium]